MKRLIYWVCLAVSALVIISCTSSSPQSRQPLKMVVDTQFTPAEKKTYELALTHINAGELEKAENALTKLGQIHPENLGVWINLATAYYQNNKLEQASDTLAYAQKIDPNVADIHNLAGLIAVERSEYKAAQKNYLAALELNKSHANAHYNLALIYDIFYQDIEKAITHYEHYLKLTTGEDKDTSSWVEELKLSLKRRGNG